LVTVFACHFDLVYTLLTVHLCDITFAYKMTHSKSRVDTFEPTHNVTLWLHRMDTERQLRQWPDAVALAEASMSMADSPLIWFLANAGRIHTWAEFEVAMKQRFGDSEQTITARINSVKMRVCNHMQMTCT